MVGRVAHSEGTAPCDVWDILATIEAFGIGRSGHRAYILRAISFALERVRGPGALEPGNPARKWWGDVSLIGSPHVVGDILHPYDIWCAGPVRWYRAL